MKFSIRDLLLVTVIVAGTFWLSFLLLLIVTPADGQTAIGLALSPFFAVFVGVLSGVIVQAVKNALVGQKTAWLIAAAASGLLALFMCWLVSEVCEAFGLG